MRNPFKRDRAPVTGQQMMDQLVPVKRGNNNEPGPPPPSPDGKRPVFQLRDVKQGTYEHNVQLNTDAFNRNTNERTWQWEVRWSAVNWEIINRAWQDGRAWNYSDAQYLELLRRKGERLPSANELDSLRGKQKQIKVPSRPILAIGSGHTLEPGLPLIKDWKGDTICSTSQASTLVYYEAPPTYIVCLDHESYPGEILIDGDWDQYVDRTALVIHPGVNPDLFEYWDNCGGRFYLFRKLQEQPPFYQVEQRLMYSRDNFNEHHERNTEGREWDLRHLESFPHEIENARLYGPRGAGPNITATVPSMGSSGAAQLQIAHELGYSPIFFAGLDFGSVRFTRHRYYDGAWHAETPQDTAAIHDPNQAVPRNLEELDPHTADPLRKDLVKADNGVWAPVIQLYYKRNIINAWRLNIANIVQTAPPDQTPFDEPPHMPIEEVIKRQGKLPEKFALTKRKVIDITDLYHARHNVWVVQFENNGIHYVEIPPQDDPVATIKAYITQIEAQKKAGRLPANLPKLEVEKTIKAVERLVKRRDRDRKARAAAEKATAVAR